MALPPLCRPSILCVFGPRMTCNPNPAGGHHQKLATLKFVRVLLKYPIEVVNLDLQGRAWKAEENDTGMSKCLVIDQLTKIPVYHDQNTRLLPGDCQDIFIGKTRWVIARDSRDVMATLTERGNQSKVSALIKEEFHSAASERAPFGGFG